MWVVFNNETGESTEDMRHADYFAAQADAFRREAHPDNVACFNYSVRAES